MWFLLNIISGDPVRYAKSLSVRIPDFCSFGYLWLFLNWFHNTSIPCFLFSNPNQQASFENGLCPVFDIALFRGIENVSR